MSDILDNARTSLGCIDFNNSNDDAADIVTAIRAALDRLQTYEAAERRISDGAQRERDRIGDTSVWAREKSVGG